MVQENVSQQEAGLGPSMPHFCAVMNLRRHSVTKMRTVFTTPGIAILDIFGDYHDRQTGVFVVANHIQITVFPPLGTLRLTTHERPATSHRFLQLPRVLLRNPRFHASAVAAMASRRPLRAASMPPSLPLSAPDMALSTSQMALCTVSVAVPRSMTGAPLTGQ
jgi:hypothetical protein